MKKPSSTEMLAAVIGACVGLLIGVIAFMCLYNAEEKSIRHWQSGYEKLKESIFQCEMEFKDGQVQLQTELKDLRERFAEQSKRYIALGEKYVVLENRLQKTTENQQ